jgi:phospholipase/carboxylesterase
MKYNSWNLRVRHASEEPARFMLLLHGWTGDENSMWLFARNFKTDLFIVAPRAPHPAKIGGYSWRAVPTSKQRPDQGKTRSLPMLMDLKPAAESLIKLVDDISVSIGVDAAQFEVAGFSQGGAMVNVLALLYPHRIRKAAVLAGFMPDGVDELLDRQVLKDVPFFVAHGSQDILITVEQARSSIELLEKAGAQVTYCEAEVGHKVSADCTRGLESFFSTL